MRLAFMGTPDFSVPTLAELLMRGHEIACVYSQPARPKGRGLTLEPSPVAAFAGAHGLPVRTPATLRTAEAQGEFSALDLDAAVVVAYGLLLPKAVLDAPRLGCFNLHGSLLPRWRGAAPIERAVMAGDMTTGVMAMRMDEGLDTGPVLSSAETKIGRKTSGDLRDELATTGAILMAEAMAALENGTARETPQDAEGATYAKKILKMETRIDWSKPAREIDCLIRGLNPAPAAWCEARGERLKILFAEPADGAGAPGTVIGEEPTIACGEGALKLMRLQRAGKSAMDAADFQRGIHLAKGERLT
jgi:methionyl-tRNA formyltransferase